MERMEFMREKEFLCKIVKENQRVRIFWCLFLAMENKLRDEKKNNLVKMHNSSNIIIFC